MRYLVGLVLALALLASPLSVNAQDAEEGATSEPGAQEPAPSSEPALEQPGLVLKWDDAGVEVVQSPPPTVDGYPSRIQYTDEPDLRVRRARIGLGISVGVFVIGGMVFGVSYYCIFDCPLPWDEVKQFRIPGLTLMAAGAAGMIASGVLLADAKRKQNSLKEARYGTLRRVQWDLARSRLVF